MKRRTSVAGWPSETNHSANRLASRSAALSQNCMCRQRRIARSGSLYEEWRKHALTSDFPHPGAQAPLPKESSADGYSLECP
jgi:hypothetical protein